LSRGNENYSKNSIVAEEPGQERARRGVPSPGGLARTVWNRKDRYGLLIAFVILLAVLSAVSPQFRTYQNAIDILRQIAVIGILACGTTVVLIGGGIDLSNADQLVFYSVVFALLVGPLNAGLGVALIVPFILAIVVGLVNGGVVAGLGLPPFLSTLGMMLLVRGISSVSSGYNDVQLIGVTSFYFIGSGMIGPVPVPIIIMIAVMVVTWFLLTKTTFGRQVYAVGGNELAAKFAGISISRIKLGTYMVSAIIAAVGGIVLTSMYRYATPRYGELGDFLLGSIAAAVIGGTSLSGGKGRITGTLVGAALIGVITNALALLNVPGYFHLLVVGAVVLVAASIDSTVQKGGK